MMNELCILYLHLLPNNEKNVLFFIDFTWNGRDLFNFLAHNGKNGIVLPSLTSTTQRQ